MASLDYRGLSTGLVSLFLANGLLTSPSAKKASAAQATCFLSTSGKVGIFLLTYWTSVWVELTESCDSAKSWSPES